MAKKLQWKCLPHLKCPTLLWPSTMNAKNAEGKTASCVVPRGLAVSSTPLALLYTTTRIQQQFTVDNQSRWRATWISATANTSFSSLAHFADSSKWLRTVLFVTKDAEERVSAACEISERIFAQALPIATTYSCRPTEVYSFARKIMH